VKHYDRENYIASKKCNLHHLKYKNSGNMVFLGVFEIQKIIY